MSEVEQDIRALARQILARRLKPSEIMARYDDACSRYVSIASTRYGDIGGTYYKQREAYKLAAKTLGLRV